jgi:hypothetical protein
MCDGLINLMLVTKRFVLVVLAAALFVAAPEANAVCARPMSPVESLLSVHLVFAGVVDLVEIRPDAKIRGPRGQPLLRQQVTFRVTQRFKGTVASGQALQFGMGGSEAFTFRRGQQVLVYAWDFRDELSTLCTRTRLVADQDKELDELQAFVSRANSVVR